MEPLDQLAHDVFSILGNNGIAAEIIGGYALSHYGYVRNTMDIDVVVSDHPKALEVLKSHGYVEGDRWFSLKPSVDSPKSVDVLPAGRVMSGSPVKNPVPTEVTTVPTFVQLSELVLEKVGVVIGNGIAVAVQTKNTADVMYLIELNTLPRDFLDLATTDEVILFEYHDIWDKVNAPRPLEKRSSPYDDPFGVFLLS